MGTHQNHSRLIGATLRSLAILLVLSLACSVSAATIESPKEGQVFKRGEKITCAGTSDEATVVVIHVKNKKDVIYGDKADMLKGGPWTISVEPPRGGWPAGEYTIELFNSRKNRVDAKVKIKIE
jgi:hypothetical protein